MIELLTGGNVMAADTARDPGDGGAPRGWALLTAASAWLRRAAYRWRPLVSGERLTDSDLSGNWRCEHRRGA
jgi:hypothetical protein